VVAWAWSIDGALAANSNSFTASLVKGSHIVTLVVTDNLGVNSQAVLGTVSITEPAAIGATYTYTGNPFIVFNGAPGITLSNCLSITLTFPSALPASMPPSELGLLGLQSWTATDGVHRISSGDAGASINPEFSFIATDASGNIGLDPSTGESWLIEADNSPLRMVSRNAIIAYDSTGFDSGGGEVLGNPGTWSPPGSNGSRGCPTYDVTETVTLTNPPNLVAHASAPSGGGIGSGAEAWSLVLPSNIAATGLGISNVMPPGTSFQNGLNAPTSCNIATDVAFTHCIATVNNGSTYFNEGTVSLSAGVTYYLSTDVFCNNFQCYEPASVNITFFGRLRK
jgi:hypothetical protein